MAADSSALEHRVSSQVLRYATMPRLIAALLCVCALPSLARPKSCGFAWSVARPCSAARSFGAAGPYEKLVGKVDFALDPALPQNRGIVDLALAPRNARGLVEFSADFYLLKPVDPRAATAACSTKPAIAAPSAS